MQTDLMNWWIEKYTPQIVNYINMVVQFEELPAEELEQKRKHLLLEFLDSSESSFLPYLLIRIDNFLDRIYTAIYKS